MLSRVAAVKAPRTHNRRGVTGSSGRRREGRESEQRRPNMSRRVSTSAVLLLLLVVMMCCGVREAASGDGSSGEGKAVDPFQGTKPAPYKWQEMTGSEAAAGSLRVPSLAEVAGGVFAVAEAQCSERDGACGHAAIASTQIETGGGGSKAISAMDAGVFLVELVDAASGTTRAQEKMQPTTIVSGDSIYMALGDYEKETSGGRAADADGWRLLLTRGTLTEDGGQKKIMWGDIRAVDPVAIGLTQFLKRVIGGGGSGVVTKNGYLVLPMQAVEKDGRSVVLSMRFNMRIEAWELSSGTTGSNCKEPSIANLEGNLILITSCAAGYYEVFRSIDSGIRWEMSGRPISRVWGNSYGRKGYGVRCGLTTVTIEGREVLLVTTPVYLEEKKGRGRLYLWVTDGARVHDAGPISDAADDAAASSLLYSSGGDLISLYENKSEGSYGLVAVHVTTQLERIKTVVKRWQELDEALRTCRPTATIDPVRRGMCIRPILTDGLVGYLSGLSTGSEWMDEYLCVNATVHGTVRGFSNGVTFEGPGAGAGWPVARSGQNQPYHFVHKTFTLVVMAVIHDRPKTRTPIPLIRVVMDDEDKTVLFGVFYTHDGRWMTVIHGGGRQILSTGWDPEKPCQVVLRHDTGHWDLYVNAREAYFGTYKGSLLQTNSISHIQFHGESGEVAESSHLSLFNARLYNRRLNSKHLRWLMVGEAGPKYDDGSSYSASASEEGSRGDSSNSESSSQKESEEVSFVHENVSWVLLLLLGLWGFAALY
ncbi:putative trans-sialidase, Group VII [Trypanosoma cruzi]|nr:putative trans-sialidase, Group VII [Trypanosoma cruzi]